MLSVPFSLVSVLLGATLHAAALPTPPHAPAPQYPFSPAADAGRSRTVFPSTTHEVAVHTYGSVPPPQHRFYPETKTHQFVVGGEPGKMNDSQIPQRHPDDDKVRVSVNDRFKVRHESVPWVRGVWGDGRGGVTDRVHVFPRV